MKDLATIALTLLAGAIVSTMPLMSQSIFDPYRFGASGDSITFVNQGQTFDGTGSTTVAVTLSGASVAAGDLIVAFAADSGSQSIDSLSDGTSSFTGLFEGSSGSLRARFFYLLSSVAIGTPTYTATFAASATGRYLGIMVFRPTSTLTYDVGVGGASAGSTVIDTNDFTITAVPSVAVAGCFSEITNTISSTTINDVSRDGQLSTNGKGMWYRIVTDSTFAGDAKGTLASSSRWVARTASFKL